MRDLDALLRDAILDHDVHLLVEWISEITTDDVVSAGILDFFDPGDDDESEYSQDSEYRY